MGRSVSQVRTGASSGPRRAAARPCARLGGGHLGGVARVGLARLLEQAAPAAAGHSVAHGVEACGVAHGVVAETLTGAAPRRGRAGEGGGCVGGAGG